MLTSVNRKRMFNLGLVAVVVSALSVDVAAAEEQLSDEARSNSVSRTIASMKKTLSLALDRLAQARKGQDVIQLNCVNEKLSAINGLVKISQTASSSLKDATAKRDEELKRHEYSKVMLAGKRVEELRLEVEGCVGEMSQYTGNTEVVVATDDDVRTDNPDVEPYSPAFEALNSERPPAVTGSE
jgi:uncharacterized protein with PhoU and TrkA domain